MSGKKKMKGSSADCSAATARLRAVLDRADAVIIGAGAGLSASAGFTYDGERFRRHFTDFEDAYGFHDMYAGGFYPYETPEEYWAYWSRYILVNRYADIPSPVYRELLGLVADKDYFVITTNVDHCFQRAGFDKKRLFYTQGDYGLFQCSTPCCPATWDNEDDVRRMVAAQHDRRIPSVLLPVCPYCGAPATMNLRVDDRFVEDDGWHLAAARYADFLRARQGQKLLFWELGVGYNTPGIIKYPFWQMTLQNPRATYACVNAGEAYAPGEIADRAICLSADVGDVLSALGGARCSAPEPS